MTTILGADELARTLRAAARRVAREGGAALMSEARPLMRKAQQRTPVDTGALRDSYELHGPKEERDEVSVTITVGGPEAPYAAAVHENQEIRHASGRSKFLESTVLEERRSLGRGLARAFKLEKVVR